jgi:hypothetical protein
MTTLINGNSVLVNELRLNELNQRPKTTSYAYTEVKNEKWLSTIVYLIEKENMTIISVFFY